MKIGYKIIVGLILIGIIIISGCVKESPIKIERKKEIVIDIIFNDTKVDQELKNSFIQELQNIKNKISTLENIEVRKWFSTIPAVSIQISLLNNVSKDEENIIVNEIRKTLESIDYVVATQIPEKEYPHEEGYEKK